MKRLFFALLILTLTVGTAFSGMKIKSMLNGEGKSLAGKLDQMGEEAAETEARCTELADSFDGKKFNVQTAAEVAPTVAVAVGLALRRVGDR